MYPTWIFDLDNTLHDAEPWIFPEMNRRMTEYMRTHLDMDHAHADILREHYWRHYGATISGLVRHHRHIDPEHFLHYTHDYPDLAERLIAMRGVRHVLRSLPGPKILFTNAQEAYAIAALRGLGVEHLFDGLVSMKQIDYRPKPDTHGYRWLCRRYQLDPRACIMVEDSRANLLTAKQLGMKTVWLTRQRRHHPAVDLRIRRLDALLRWKYSWHI